MQVLRRLAGLGWIAASLTVFAPAAADAGAWTRAAGEGLSIATTARRAAPVGALAGGVADSEATVSQIYLEYGLTDALTLGAKVYMELSSTDADGSSASLGAFLRVRLWQGESGGIASVQGGYAHPIGSLVGGAFALSKPGAVPEAHLAALYGKGWGGDWGSAFVSTGATYLWRGEHQADELRFEVTGGYRPWRRWMGMLGLYALAPLGPGTDASLKLAPSIAYTMWPYLGWNEKKPRRPVNPSTIQLGIAYDLLNRDDGLGVSLSVWQPF